MGHSADLELLRAARVKVHEHCYFETIKALRSCLDSDLETEAAEATWMSGNLFDLRIHHGLFRVIGRPGPFPDIRHT